MKSLKWISSVAVAGVVCAAVAACGSGASSGSADGDQEMVDLRVNTFIPTKHHYVTDGWEPFIEEVKEKTDGQVNFSVAGQETLGPATDSLTLLKSGVAGAAESTAGYHSANLPMSQISGAFGWETGVLASQAAWEMCNSEPWVSEFKKAGVVPIGCSGTPPYELFTSGEPIESVPEDFENLKVRTVGIQSDIMTNLGAAPQTIPSPELYQSLDRGVIDAYLLPRVGVFPLGLEPLNKYVTEGMNAFSSGFAFQMISQETWDKFTDETKEIIIEAGKKLSLADGAGYDEMMVDLVDSGKGLTDNPPEVYEVSAEEQEALTEATDQALDAWIGARDEDGLGSEAQAAVDVLRELRELQPAPIDEWAEFAY